MNYSEIGQVVISKSGRDKGNFFVIVDVIDEYVYLVDGDLRRIENPKKKKLKHIQPTNIIINQLQKDFVSGVKVSNADVRKALDLYCEKKSNSEELI